VPDRVLSRHAMGWRHQSSARLQALPKTIFWTLSSVLINFMSRRILQVFFSPLVANTQLNHWTRRLVGTQLITQDPKKSPEPSNRGQPRLWPTHLAVFT